MVWPCTPSFPGGWASDWNFLATSSCCWRRLSPLFWETPSLAASWDCPLPTHWRSGYFVSRLWRGKVKMWLGGKGGGARVLWLSLFNFCFLIRLFYSFIYLLVYFFGRHFAHVSVVCLSVLFIYILDRFLFHARVFLLLRSVVSMRYPLFCLSCTYGACIYIYVYPDLYVSE